MALTYMDLQKHIKALQMEAEKAKNRERDEVIGRIREAIAAYELTAQELFGVPRRAGRKAKVKASDRVVNSKRAPSKAKFKDPDSDKTWTGMGKKPGWFVSALEAGKTKEDLAV